MTGSASEHKSRWPAWAREFSTEVRAHLDRMEKHIMADQDKLNADIKALNDGLATIETEIQTLKSQPAAAGLDFSGLDAAVSRLQVDDTEAAPSPAPVVSPTPPAGA